MPYLDQTGLSVFWNKVKNWTRSRHGASISKGTATQGGIPLNLMNGADTPVALGATVTITKEDIAATGAKVTDTVYAHPAGGAPSKAAGLYKFSTDATSHVASVAAVAKSDITALGIPAQDTTYKEATQAAAGLMGAADKKKLDGVEAGANKYVHPASAAGAKASGLYKVATDAQGHVTAAVAVAKSDITALGIPGSQPTVTDEKVKTVPAMDGAEFYLVGTENPDGGTGTLDVSGGVFVKSLGDGESALVATTGIYVGKDEDAMIEVVSDAIIFPDGKMLTSENYEGNAASADIAKTASLVYWSGVKNVPSASTTTAGIVKLGTAAGTAAAGDHTHDTDEIASASADFDGDTLTEVIDKLNTKDGELSKSVASTNTELGKKAPIASPALTGTPTAPTAAAGTSTTQIATCAFVASALASAMTGAAKYKGGITPDAYSKLTSYTQGWYWVVTAAGTIAGEACEVGDMVFCNASNSGASTKKDSHFDVVQDNITAIPASAIDALA